MSLLIKTAGSAACRVVGKGRGHRVCCCLVGAGSSRRVVAYRNMILRYYRRKTSNLSQEVLFVSEYGSGMEQEVKKGFVGFLYPLRPSVTPHTAAKPRSKADVLMSESVA